MPAHSVGQSQNCKFVLSEADMQDLIRQQMIIETITMVFAVATSCLSALYRGPSTDARRTRRSRMPPGTRSWRFFTTGYSRRRTFTATFRAGAVLTIRKTSNISTSRIRRCMETALGKRRMRQLWDSPRSSMGKRRRARSRRLIFSFHRVREESVTGIFCKIYANGAEFSTAKVKENPA